MTFGVASGALLALMLARFLAAYLYGVGPRDPVSFAAAAAVIAVGAGTACVVPALRAARVEPNEVLRCE
jgi:ABC-type lipoprotein release transport system permease subunit